MYFFKEMCFFNCHLCLILQEYRIFDGCVFNFVDPGVAHCPAPLTVPGPDAQFLTFVC